MIPIIQKLPSKNMMSPKNLGRQIIENVTEKKPKISDPALKNCVDH